MAETISVTNALEDLIYPPTNYTEHRVPTEDMVYKPKSRSMMRRILESHRLSLEFAAARKLQSHIIPFSVSAHAVFFQVAATPIKLLAVPARPTIPSSRFKYPRAETGIVRSQMSERSWVLVAARSLETFVSSSILYWLSITYLASFLLWTTPSPSLLSIRCSLCRSCHKV